MQNYYNELDPFAVELLNRLIRCGQIPSGFVDTRSIEDVRPYDLRGFTQCHFFAGLGGWSEALRLARWPDDEPIWTGSCPCQPFSAAGKGNGFADERHLWPAWFHLISQCQPARIAGEQVASASEWIKLVRGDLEGLGYAVGAIPIEAASAGAIHKRDRWWFVADAIRHQQSRQEPRVRPVRRMGGIIEPVSWNTPWQSALSRFRTMGDGLQRNLGATDAARNAIVPQVAEKVIRAAFMEF